MPLASPISCDLSLTCNGLVGLGAVLTTMIAAQCWNSVRLLGGFTGTEMSMQMAAACLLVRILFSLPEDPTFLPSVTVSLALRRTCTLMDYTSQALGIATALLATPLSESVWSTVGRYLALMWAVLYGIMHTYMDKRTIKYQMGRMVC